MFNKVTIAALLIYVSIAPLSAMALDMPQSGNDLAAYANLSAQAYAVVDTVTGQTLISKNADQPWPPASLTKLVTILVVMDNKPKMSKLVTMTANDQLAGQCTAGGACIKSKAGVKFTVEGLLHAALLPSANNAAYALARSTGLSNADFVKQMNQKALSLGAIHTTFVEPSGLDPTNSTTAADYAKIVQAAFTNTTLKNISAKSSYYLRSSNNSKYSQTIKNTDRLLADSDVTIIGAKTGYLDESKYNFVSLVKYGAGDPLAVSVLGTQHFATVFSETKTLAKLANDARAIFAFNNLFGAVLGASTTATGTKISN